MIVEHKKPNNLNLHELRQLNRLHLGFNGSIHDELKWCRRHNTVNSDVVMVKDTIDRILGWALIFPYKPNKRMTYLYVRKTNRRQGVGTLLMQEINKLTKKPYVCPHNPSSGKFFKANRKLVTIERGDWGADYLKS